MFFISVLIIIAYGTGFHYNKEEPQSNYSKAYFQCVRAAELDKVVSIGDCNRIINPDSVKVEMTATDEQIKNVMSRELEDVIQTKVALDGALGDYTFIPLIQHICNYKLDY